MLYGMTYDEYWYGESYRAAYYRKMHKLQIEQRNEELWLSGLYVCNAMHVAVGNCLSKEKQEYMKEPIRLFPPDESERQKQIAENNRKLVERLNRFKEEFDRRNKKG